jgi:hypothetical protein
MSRPLLVCEPFAVARVPLPLGDRAAWRRRPALVISASPFQRASAHGLLAWVQKFQPASWGMVPEDRSEPPVQSAGSKPRAAWMRKPRLF